jgi:hypothetical protein
MHATTVQVGVDLDHAASSGALSSCLLPGYLSSSLLGVKKPSLSGRQNSSTGVPAGTVVHRRCGAPCQHQPLPQTGSTGMLARMASPTEAQHTVEHTAEAAL